MSRFSEENGRSELIRRVTGRMAARRICSGRFVAALSLCSLILLSCATIPPSRPADGWLGVLPSLTPDAFYASMDVASSWSVLKALAEATGSGTGELERLVVNLDRVHALIRLSPGGSPQPLPELSLIALGQFSPGPVVRQLNRDPAWQRVTLEPLPGRDSTSSHWSYRTYWSKKELQIAAPSRGILLVSVSDPTGAEALLRRLHAPEVQTLPAQVGGAPESADIFLYVPDPAALSASRRSVSTTQDPGALLQNLPLRQAWISARRYTSEHVAAKADQEDYEVEVVFLLAEVENPRSVELLLRLMLTLWLRKFQVEDPVETLKAVTIRADSQSARIESLFLSSGEIASVVDTLLPENLGRSGQP
jgi:hypothetical protein